MKKPIIKFVLLTALFYFAGLTFVKHRGNTLRKDLYKYDLNKDGVFSGKERTEEQMIALKRYTSDTGRTYAVNTLIPMSFIASLLVFAFFRKTETV